MSGSEGQRVPLDAFFGMQRIAQLNADRVDELHRAILTGLLTGKFTVLGEPISVTVEWPPGLRARAASLVNLR